MSLGIGMEWSPRRPHLIYADNMFTIPHPFPSHDNSPNRAVYIDDDKQITTVSRESLSLVEARFQFHLNPSPLNCDRVLFRFGKLFNWHVPWTCLCLADISWHLWERQPTKTIQTKFGRLRLIVGLWTQGWFNRNRKSLFWNEIWYTDNWLTLSN